MKFYVENCEIFHYLIVMAFFLFLAVGFELLESAIKEKKVFFMDDSFLQNPFCFQK